MFSGPARGLWTSPNPFSKTPEGTLKVADNVDFVAPGVIEPRRGFNDQYDFGDGDSIADQIAFYAEKILVAYDSTRIAIGPDPNGEFFTWPSLTAAPVGDNRMRFEGAARSLFFNTSAGAMVFDGSTPTGTVSVSDAAARALAYGSGSGAIAGNTTITGGTSSAVGTIALAGYGNTSGTLFFSSISGGPFQLESLAGDITWTGTSTSVDYPAILVTITSSVPVGAVLVGITSGATATVASAHTSGSSQGLGLRGITGEFLAGEDVVFGTTALLPYLAGCPPPLATAALLVSGSDAWLEDDTAVAYRSTICRKDAFGRIIEGPPSGRTVIANILPISAGNITRVTNIVTVTTISGIDNGYQIGDTFTLSPGEANFAAGLKTITAVAAGFVQYAEAGANASSTVLQYVQSTRQVELSIYLPDDASVDNFVRTYRSVATSQASDSPSDELFLVNETSYLTEAEIAAEVVSFTDITPESLLEIPLYTNANTGDGTLAANSRPPNAIDIAYWQNRMWYLGTIDRHSAQLELIGVGSPDGIQNNDVLVFVPNGSVLGGEDNIRFIAGTDFDLYQTSDPGTNIQKTTENLVLAINLQDTSPYAFYVSSEFGAPGKMLLQARSFGDADGFSVYSSRPSAWTPQLPSDTAPLWAPLQSSNNAHAARVAYSKLGQPEAVPLLNFEQINDDGAPALRMMALNYRLIIFKTDGIYYIPTGFPVSLQKLSDHVLIAPDSVQRLGDRLFFLTDQGMATLDGSGVSLKEGAPIKETFSRLNDATSLEALKTRTVGVSYRSADRYLLWTLERDDLGAISTDNEQAFAYSTDEGGFTRYTFGVRAAGINPSDDTLVVTPTNDNRLWVERKTQTQQDYKDPNDAAIDCKVTFNDFAEQAPAVMKMTKQCSYLFRENGVPTITATFASEIHPEEIGVQIETEAWGTFPWGEVPWGGFVRRVRRIEPLPVGAANCCQLSVGFEASCFERKFGFLGVDLDAAGDTKANRG